MRMSFWSYSLYTNCPASYKLQYIERALDGLPTNKRVAVEGAVGHSMLELYYKNGIEDQAWLTSNVEKFFEAFTTENMIIWKGETEEEKQTDRAQSLEDTKFMMKNMTEIINGYGLFPVECKPEHSFEFQLTPMVFYAGRWDMWMQTKKGERFLLDWKFTKKKGSPKKEQLMGYKLACDNLKLAVDKIGFVYPWFGEIIWKDLGKVATEDYIKDLEGAVVGIEKKEFPYTPSRFHCGFCDCRSICDPYKTMQARFQVAMEGLKIGENEI